MATHEIPREIDRVSDLGYGCRFHLAGMRREAQNSRVGLLLFLRRIGPFALFLACVTVCRAEQAPKWIQTYNGLLGKYVTNGGVKYAAWKNNPADMQAVQQVFDGIARRTFPA